MGGGDEGATSTSIGEGGGRGNSSWGEIGAGATRAERSLGGLTNGLVRGMTLCVASIGLVGGGWIKCKTLKGRFSLARQHTQRGQRQHLQQKAHFPRQHMHRAHRQRQQRRMAAIIMAARMPGFNGGSLLSTPGTTTAPSPGRSRMKVTFVELLVELLELLTVEDREGVTMLLLVSLPVLLPVSLPVPVRVEVEEEVEVHVRLAVFVPVAVADPEEVAVEDPVPGPLVPVDEKKGVGDGRRVGRGGEGVDRVVEVASTEGLGGAVGGEVEDGEGLG